MNYEAIRKRMVDFFENTPAEKIVENYEQIGYEFEDIIIIDDPGYNPDNESKMAEETLNKRTMNTKVHILNPTKDKPIITNLQNLINECMDLQYHRETARVNFETDLKACQEELDKLK